MFTPHLVFCMIETKKKTVMIYSFEFLLNYAEVIKISSYCRLTQEYRFTRVCVCMCRLLYTYKCNACSVHKYRSGLNHCL